jgi:hypothetical protein
VINNFGFLGELLGASVPIIPPDFFSKRSAGCRRSGESFSGKSLWPQCLMSKQSIVDELAQLELSLRKTAGFICLP